jgi:hypothetical protein
VLLVMVDCSIDGRATLGATGWSASSPGRRVLLPDGHAAGGRRRTCRAHLDVEAADLAAVMSAAGVACRHHRWIERLLGRGAAAAPRGTCPLITPVLGGTPDDDILSGI